LTAGPIDESTAGVALAVLEEALAEAAGWVVGAT
jgi:hypothetical protein